jgi:hypothetical protein
MEQEQFESCAICGRTILKGERVSEYVTGDGERHRVCSLCKARAEAAGWIPAEQAGPSSRPAPRRSRGVALRDAFSRAAERVRQPRPQPDVGPEAEAEPARDEPHPRPKRRQTPAAKEKPKRAAAPKRKAPTKGRTQQKQQAGRKSAGQAKTKQPHPKQSQGSSAERRLRRAVERFNESEEAKVVSGLIKTLGEPRASVKSVSAKPPRVAVTVAWELSWYRWEVSQDGDEVTVREVAKGDEVTELADEAKQWNAKVDGEGNVRLALADARRQAAKAAE